MLKKISTGLLVFFLTILSFYTIWGWLTIQDIRLWCSKNGVDAEDVLYKLAQENVDFSITDEPNVFNVTTIPNTYGKISVQRFILPFSRVRMTQIKTDDKQKSDANIVKYKKQEGMLIFSREAKFLSFSLLEPFLNFSENFNNLLCCFGIGYVTGLLVVGNRFLKQHNFSNAILIFRPLLGALASCILLIIIISGGAVIWNEIAGIKGLSLGMIGVIGSLFCDRLKVLTASL